MASELWHPEVLLGRGRRPAPALRRRGKKLLTLFLVLGVLGGVSAESGAVAAIRSDVVLELEDERRRGCQRLRYQRRHVRSAAAGTITVTYRSGRTAAGACVHPAEIGAVAPRGMAFSYDTMAEVMRLRHVELLQREEVRVELAAEGFPFDLPNLHYARHCAMVLTGTEEILARLPVRPDDPLHQRIVRLRTLLRHVGDSGVLARGIARLAVLDGLFANLRNILHPRRTDRQAPLNWGRIEQPQHLPDIARALDTLRERARRKTACKSLGTGDRKAWRIIHSHLADYAGKLNPILVVRDRTFLLPRTNNLSETAFRDLKRRQRRTTGNGDLSRQLDHMPPQVFYAANLTDPNYCRLVFGDSPMHEAFATADWTAVKTAAAAMAAPASPGAVDRELVGSPGFFATVGAALAEELGERPASPIAATPVTP